RAFRRVVHRGRAADGARRVAQRRARRRDERRPRHGRAAVHRDGAGDRRDRAPICGGTGNDAAQPHRDRGMRDYPRIVVAPPGPKAREIVAALCERLAKLEPGPSEKRVFLSNSGTEAVEGAIKLARHSTGRPAVIAFLGAFHGRTYGGLSLTASKAIHRAGFAPFLPEV